MSIATRPYQREALDAVHKAAAEGLRRGLVVMPTGAGKGHPLDTEVPTPDGLRLWGSLAVGDRVFGSDGNPVAVSGVFDRGVLPLYRVTMKHGESVLVDREHLWQVKRKGRLPRVVSTEWIAAQPLLDRDGWLRSIPVAGPVQRAAASLPLHPYVVGALLANGGMTHSGTILTTPDYDVVRRVREHVPAIRELGRYAGRTCPTFSLLGLCDVTRALGLRVHSRAKRVPRIYLEASIGQRRGLLQGLMDGDGSVRHDGRRSVCYFTSSVGLADDMAELVTSLGGTCSTSCVDRGEKGVEYKLNILLPLDLDATSTPRKTAERGPSKSFRPRSAIVSVEPAGEAPVRCITVDAPDALYLVTRRHIVTHNTITFAHLIQERGGRAVVLAHRDELVRQAVDKLRMVDPTMQVGVVKADEDEVSAPVVVASVQTLARPSRLDRLVATTTTRSLFGEPEPLTTLIADEAQHYPAGEDGNTFGRVLEGLGAFRDGGPLTVGFTATPDALMAQDGLAGGWQRTVFQLGILDGIAGGWLVDIRAKQVQIAADFRRLHTRGGEIKDEESEQMLLEADAPHYVAQAYLAHARDRKGVVFTPTVLVAHRMAAALRDAGVPAEAVDGAMPMDERRAVLRRLTTGETRVACNCNVLCLDTETEILTSAGWVGPGEMTLQHRVANWWPDRVTFEEPKEVVRRPRMPGERMVFLETPRRSIRVTEGHRMLYRATRTGRFLKTAARDLVGKSVALPVSGIGAPAPVTLPEEKKPQGSRSKRISKTAHTLRATGLSKSEALAEATRRLQRSDALRYARPEELSLADCEFIGFWCGDGSRARLSSGGVEYVLTQSERYPTIIAWVDGVIARMGVHALRKLRPIASSKLVPAGSKHGQIRWSLARGTGSGVQAREGLYRIEPYLQKAGSDLYWGFTEEQFDAFMRGLWYADGHHGDGTRIPALLSITGASYEFFSLLQAIAVCRGYRASIRNYPEPRPGLKQLYHLNCEKEVAHRMSNRLPASVLRFEDGWRDETVWCVRTTSGNLITRRKGSVTVMGNTEGWDEPSISCVVMARPTKSRPFALQCIGRGLRPFPGKADCLVLDVVGSAVRQDLMTVAALFGVSQKGAGRGVLQAVLDVQEAAQKAGQAPPHGRLIVRDVALFDRHAFAWVQGSGGDRFILSLGKDGNLILEPCASDPERWDVVQSQRVVVPGAKFPQTVRKRLYTGIDLNLAMGIAEDRVRQAGAQGINARDARWRHDSPSEKQEAILRKRGRWRDGMSRGDASDAITAMFAR